VFKSLRLYWNVQDLQEAIVIDPVDGQGEKLKQAGIRERFLDLLFDRAFFYDSVLSNKTRAVDVPSHLVAFFLGVTEDDVQHAVTDPQDQAKMLEIFHQLKDLCRRCIDALNSCVKITEIAPKLIVDVLKS
jgi:hypothetical protein